MTSSNAIGLPSDFTNLSSRLPTDPSIVVQPYADPGYAMPNPQTENLNQAPGLEVGGYLRASDISPKMRGFLDTIAVPESGGQYNVRYGGKNGPQHFGDLTQHPNVAEDIPGMDGYHSTAAGRYQFLNSTWMPIADKLGLKDFSAGSQDKAAAYLASTTYKNATGRDLEGDIGDPSKTPQIVGALKSQWPTIGVALGGKAGATQVAEAAPQVAATAPAPPASTTAASGLWNNPQLAQMQRLAMLNRLMPQQAAPPNYAAAANSSSPTAWANALLASGQQSNPLQVLQQVQALKYLQQNGGSLLG